MSSSWFLTQEAEFAIKEGYNVDRYLIKASWHQPLTKRVEKGIKSYSDEHRVKIITSDEEFVNIVKEAKGELVSRSIWTYFIYPFGS